MAATFQDIRDLYGDLLWVASTLDESNPVRANQVRDLARQAQGLEKELESAQAHKQRLMAAVKAVLLFRSDSPWTPQKAAHWMELTGQSEASTKALYDTLRKALETSS